MTRKILEEFPPWDWSIEPARRLDELRRILQGVESRDDFDRLGPPVQDMISHLMERLLVGMHRSRPPNKLSLDGLYPGTPCDENRIDIVESLENLKQLLAAVSDLEELDGTTWKKLAEQLSLSLRFFEKLTDSQRKNALSNAPKLVCPHCKCMIRSDRIRGWAC